MAQFDYLDQVKNRLIEQFQPTSSSANPTLPPGYGQTAAPPDLGISAGQGAAPEMGGAAPSPSGMESYMPPPEAGIPAPTGPQQMLPAAQAPAGLGQVSLEQLIGMGLNAFLIGLLTQQAPQAGGIPPTGGVSQGGM